MSDDFFVGYLPMPRDLARRLRWIAGGMAIAAILVALVAAFFQSGYAAAAFEFGRYRTYAGVILEQPYPMLLVPRPGQTRGGEGSFSAYLLVDPGKHGADEHVRGLAGKHVRVQAELIYREDHTMLELKPGPLEITEAETGVSVPRIRPLGQATVTGEIVDSKCYLGVMNPGSGKVHRDCAARCISGGVPAALAAIDREHAGSIYLLKAADGGRLPGELLARTGELLTIHGEALAIGDQLVLLVPGPSQGPL